MRRNTFCYARLLIADTVLAGAGAGEDQQAAPQAKPERQQGSAAGGATREAPVAGAMPLELTIEQKMLLLKRWRASKLIGASVYNDQDKRIGKIEDMIVSPGGKVSAAVIEVGGFLGIGKHRVAIPADDFADIKAKKAGPARRHGSVTTHHSAAEIGELIEGVDRIDAHGRHRCSRPCGCQA